jgi:hypothetical protein
MGLMAHLEKLLWLWQRSVSGVTRDLLMAQGYHHL